jgi:hypothetical protein
MPRPNDRCYLLLISHDTTYCFTSVRQGRNSVHLGKGDTPCTEKWNVHQTSIVQRIGPILLTHQLMTTIKVSPFSYDNVECRHFSVTTFKMSSLSDDSLNVVTK